MNEKIAEIWRTIETSIYISREEILKGIKDLFQKPMLIIDLIDNLTEHYATELNAHTRYYEEFKKKIESGDTTKHTKELCDWQLQNKTALEKLLSDLATYRTQIRPVLQDIETCHKIRGWKGEAPWNRYNIHPKETES